MSDERSIKAPKVKSITSEYTFTQFDSLMCVDAGSSGFRIKDSSNNVTAWPTGVPFAIGKQEGKASGPITIMAPESGSLNVSAVYYE